MSSSENNPLNLIPKSLDNAVKNLSDLPTQSIGQTLSDIWYLVIGGPIHQLTEKRSMKYAQCLEQYKNDLIASIEQIPAEKRVEPDIHNVSLALDNSKYCVEQATLRKMFVELVSSSMSSDKESSVHPSFSEIIKQMNDLDAVIFDLLYKQVGNANIPLVHPTVTIQENNRYFNSATPKWFLGDIAEGFDLLEFSSCLENLNRLGLLELHYDRTISNSSGQYQIIKSSQILTQILEKYQQLHPEFTLRLQFTDCVARFSDFGLQFGKVCLPGEGYLGELLT